MTLDVSHFQISESKLVHKENILDISVTLDLSQFVIKLDERENTDDMSMTLDISHLKMWDPKLDKDENIDYISITLDVSHLEMSVPKLVLMLFVL